MDSPYREVEASAAKRIIFSIYEIPEMMRFAA